jgi:hypothetical protein
MFQEIDFLMSIQSGKCGMCHRELEENELVIWFSNSLKNSWNSIRFVYQQEIMQKILICGGK